MDTDTNINHAAASMSADVSRNASAYATKIFERSFRRLVQEFVLKYEDLCLMFLLSQTQLKRSPNTARREKIGHH